MKRRGSISWGDCLLHAFFALVLTYTVYLFLTITSGTSHWWMLAALAIVGAWAFSTYGAGGNGGDASKDGRSGKGTSASDSKVPQFVPGGLPCAACGTSGGGNGSSGGKEGGTTGTGDTAGQQSGSGRKVY